MSYSLKDSWIGDQFINGNSQGDKWSFYTKADPTHGAVRYGAWNELISYPNNTIKIDVESEGYDPSQGPNRKAIRINTDKTYNGGLFIIDLDNIPEGLSVWPSIWLLGTGPQPWPEYGEIDIIEGVNSTASANNKNQSTLHTKAGCIQNVPGVINSDCNSANAHNGCGVMGPDNSFGHGFNTNGGGVYVCEWINDESIKVWFWARNEVPANALSATPDPSSWSAPYVHFTPCPGYFKDMKMIINTTLCGDWAGQVYPDGGAGACAGYVKDVNNNSKYADAYFQIRSLKVFQTS